MMNVRRNQENPLKLNRSVSRSTLTFYVPPFRFDFQISGPISKRGRRTILLLVFRKIRELFEKFYEAELDHWDSHSLSRLFPPREISFRETPNIETALGRSGYALRVRRHRNNLTLRELSEISGLTLHHLSNIERGKCRPRKQTLEALEKALAHYEEEGIICLSPSRTSIRKKIAKTTSSAKSCTEIIEAALAPRSSGKHPVGILDRWAEMWAAQRALEESLAASKIDSDT